MEIKNHKIYLGSKSADFLAKKFGMPLYVYEADLIKKRYQDFLSNIKYKNLNIHYSCKANSNIEILKVLKKEGCNIETVSEGEVRLALKAGFKPDQIIFTCANIDTNEMKFLVRNNILMNLDSFNQIAEYGKLNAGGKIGIRINQGFGSGHHEHCITGGKESKFGIYFSQVKEAKKIAQR